MKKFLFNTLKNILRVLAQLTIKRFQPKVIAITGSAGKTSSKETIYAVLKDKFRVRKSIGNFNNEIGMPLAILGEWTEEQMEIVSLSHKKGAHFFRKIWFWNSAIFGGAFRLIFQKKEDYPEILILEYGAENPGDIRYLLNIAKPYIGVITTVGDIPPHVEFFSSPEALAREKAKLVESLPISNFAILNHDVPSVLSMTERTRAIKLTFGFSEDADVRIIYFENRLTGSKENPEPAGIVFKIKYGGTSVPIQIDGILGRGQAYAAAIAVCVGIIFEINLVEIANNLKNYAPAKGRLNLIPGIKNTLIIDDTYNASPLSVSEALDILDDLPAKRKIAILGDMLELGKYTEEAHEKIGKKTKGIVNTLFTIGAKSIFTAEGAKKAGLKKIFSYDLPEEAINEIKTYLKEGDLVLVKASRSIHLEKIVDEIRNGI